jgi:murein DD-endopeptidase MepM/ murein hydrolase activator NlpD
MRPVVLVACLATLALSVVACGTSGTSYDSRIEVTFSDIPYPTEANLRIPYMIKAWEWEKDGLTLQQIEVLDEATKEVLDTLDATAIAALHVYKDPLPASPYFQLDTLTSYYFSLQLPIPLGKAPPQRVFHRLLFARTADGAQVTVAGAPFAPRLAETPMAIASPVKGENLMFMNQSTNGYHFYVSLFLDGDIYRLERFGLDSTEIAPDHGGLHDGDETANGSYYNYGRTLHAVADGTVVHLQDGRPENNGNLRDIATTIATADEYFGNYLILDLGGGKFAYYVHCIAGSFQVAEGDTVKEGDPLAQLGNSGNSDLPHLHFHIADSAVGWHAKGIPLVLKEYTKTGTFVEPGVFTAATETTVTNAMMEKDDVFNVAGGTTARVYDPRLQVFIDDIPYKTEENLRIGYTLKAWEWEKEGLVLDQIEVLDEATREVLSTLDAAAVASLHIFKDPLPENAFFAFDTLTSYYFSLQLPIPLSATPPARVLHRLHLTRTATGAQVTVLGGAFAPRLDESPLVIASPLKGNNLYFLNQSTNDYHFYTAVFTSGQMWHSERYAIDTIEFDDTITNYFTGTDETINTAYLNYGRALHAVADGTVVHLQDGRLENDGTLGNQKPTFTTADEYAGNYLVLDIGGGNFAFYCHIIPGSFLVAQGDTVTEGTALAQLGNSGNSDFPHLHFHVADRNALFESFGVPFVLKEYEKRGTFEQPGPGVPLTPTTHTDALMEQTTVFNVND